MSHYCNIDDRNREHIKNLIIWIFDEVISAGGDGDALWYSIYFHVDDLLPLVKEVMDEFGYGWTIRKEDDSISASYYQEGVFITNNKQHWDEAPSWQQVKIHY